MQQRSANKRLVPGVIEIKSSDDENAIVIKSSDEEVVFNDFPQFTQEESFAIVKAMRGHPHEVIV